jgi:hypothetical protein
MYLIVSENISHSLILIVPAREKQTGINDQNWHTLIGLPFLPFLDAKFNTRLFEELAVAVVVEVITIDVHRQE